MMLDRLSPTPGSRRPRKRLGRGIGSGTGKTSGRGQKGAGARSGFKRRDWFEGGQISLARRLPKRGFTNVFRQPNQVVNVGSLARFEANSELDPMALALAGLIPSSSGRVKILAEGELSIPLVVRAHAVSKAAADKIQAAGGRVELLSPGSTPDEKGSADQ